MIIFRELPDLAKQYVMRLLLLDGAISLSVVGSWANTAGQWYTLIAAPYTNRDVFLRHTMTKSNHAAAPYIARIMRVMDDVGNCAQHFVFRSLKRNIVVQQ